MEDISQEKKIPENKGSASDETLTGSIDQWIKCRDEVNELNKKLLSLCKDDKELRWVQKKGFLNFQDY